MAAIAARRAARREAAGESDEKEEPVEVIGRVNDDLDARDAKALEVHDEETGTTQVRRKSACFWVVQNFIVADQFKNCLESDRQKEESDHYYWSGGRRKVYDNGIPTLLRF